jgi:NAD(P)-dependent dehydrogenase (short-subunit alcohol dehydrogenase family)
VATPRSAGSALTDCHAEGPGESSTCLGGTTACLFGLIKSAALELGEHRITVNAVIPGLVDTTLTRHEDRYVQAIESAGRTPSGNQAEDEKTAIEVLTATSPLGVPWVQPEDVAPLVTFLASDAAGMVSGTAFAATGGDSANFQ